MRGDRLLFKRDAGFTVSFRHLSHILVREDELLGTITAGRPDRTPRSAGNRSLGASNRAFPEQLAVS